MAFVKNILRWLINWLQVLEERLPHQRPELELMGWISDSAWAVLAGTVAERFRSNFRLRRAQRNVSGGALIALGLASAFSGAQTK